MRGFVAALHLCAAVYVGLLMYRPSPAKAVPVKVASWLKTDKAQDRVKPIPVKTESIKPPPTVVVPAECRVLAASVDMPTKVMTADEVRKAKAMLKRAENTREVRRCRAAIDKGLRDARCDGPARYEAMSEGANCS